MRNNPFSCNCICANSLSLLISALGTAIFSFVTLIVFLIFGIIITALVIISIIFLIVTLIALVLFLHCLAKQTCRPPDYCHEPRKRCCG